MTNEEKAIEFATTYDGRIISFAHLAALQMAGWKDEQLKKVCKKCEQHIIDSGKAGCAFRSLGNEYCWED